MQYLFKLSKLVSHIYLLLSLSVSVLSPLLLCLSLLLSCSC